MAYNDQTLSFGPFMLIRSAGVLLEHGRPVRLGERAFGILVALVERAGEVVGKNELIAFAWPGGVAEETTLRVHVAALRKVLGDGQNGMRYIANVAGRGYCFVATVGRPVAPALAVAAGIHNLPLRLNRIVGRAELVATVVANLPRRRLVTLCGAGGMGKSSVALAVAENLLHAYPEGVRYVDLGLLADPRMLPGTVAGQLGLAQAGASNVATLAQSLQMQRTLLLLDGCEHVLEAMAELVVAVLAQAPDVNILVTSREPLRCDGEWVQRVPSLQLPDDNTVANAESALQYAAVQLFVERAIASVDSFVLRDADVPAVIELCRRLDGMPLAIELAAARVDAFGVHGLVRLLDDRFNLLSNGNRNVLPRHRTLRAALDWSYDALTSAEQLVLRRLSVFNGEFLLVWARRVSEGNPIDGIQAQDCIVSLAAKSLIIVDVGEQSVRYRLLDSTRVYAFEKLDASGERPVIQRLHAELWLHLLEDPRGRPVSLSRAEWIAGYGRMVEDLRAALAWSFSPEGDNLLAASIVAGSVALGLQLSLLHEYRDYLARIVPALPSLPEALRFQLKSAMAVIATQADGPGTEPRRLTAMAPDPDRTPDDPATQAEAYSVQWITLFGEGNYRQAAEAARLSGQMMRQLGNAMGSLNADRILAQACHFLGDHTRARRLCEHVLGHPTPHIRLGPETAPPLDRRVSMRILLARILWMEGLPDSANTLAQESVELAQTDVAYALCQALGLAAVPVALWRGDFEAAALLAERLTRHAKQLRMTYWQTWGELFLAVLDWHAKGRGAMPQSLLARVAAGGAKIGDMFCTLAPGLLLESQVTRVELGDVGWCAPEVLRVRGLREQQVGAWLQAETLFLRAVTLAEKQQARGWQLRAATSLAELWQTQGRGDEVVARLAPIVAAFHEGAGNADLVHARAVLHAAPGHPLAALGPTLKMRAGEPPRHG